MNVIKFKYDKFGIIHSIAFIIIAIVIISVTSFSSNSGPYLFPIVAITVLVTLITYIAVIYLTPLLKGKHAMVIDDDKIFIRRRKKVIFWHDVSKIDRLIISRSYYLIIHLKNNTQLRINPLFYKAEADMIYKTLQKFFNNINQT